MNSAEKRWAGNPADRFWLRVDKSGDCWIWIGPKTGHGYGQFQSNKKRYKAHRYAWELENGPIPIGLEACHRCDNPACVRPSHIFLATHAENMRDCSRKGRNGMQRYPERSSLRNVDTRVQVRGEQQGNAKLTADKVRAIRQMRADGVMTSVIAANMGIATSTVQRIVRRADWKHVL